MSSEPNFTDRMRLIASKTKSTPHLSESTALMPFFNKNPSFTSPYKKNPLPKGKRFFAREKRQQIPFPSLAGQTVIVRQAVLLARFLALLRLPKVSPSGILQHRSPYSGVTAPALTGFSFQLIEHLSQFRFYFIILCYPKACALSIHLHKCYERMQCS